MLVTLGITALFGIGLPNIRLDTSSEGLMAKGDPAKEYYEITKKTFGDDVLISVVVHVNKGDVFTQPILTAVGKMTEEIYKVEGVSRVDSLSTHNRTVGESGFLNTNRLMEFAPQTQEEVDEVRKIAMNDPTLTGNILSKDGTTTAINAFFTGGTKNNLERNAALAITAIAENNLQTSDITIYPIGMPVIKTVLSDKITAENKLLLPLCIGIILLIIYWIFRSLVAALIPIVTGLISLIWCLGLMGLTGMDFNVISTLIPVLMIVVGATEDVHLISEYYQGLREGHDKEAAIRHMNASSAMAISLTSFTTFIGFATVIINTVPWLKEFAIVGSFGIAANFLITIIIVPAMLKVFRKPNVSAEEDHSGLLHRMAKALPGFIEKRQAAIATIVILACLFLAAGVTKLKVSSNFVAFFKEDAPVRQNFDRVHQDLAGAQTFFIIIDSKTEGGLKQPAVLKDILAIQDFIAKDIDSSKSIADSIRLINREMNDGNAAFYNIPDNPELTAQYFLMLDSADLERVADFELRKASVLVRHNVSASWQLDEVLDRAREFAKTNFKSGATVEFTGENVLINQGAKAIANNNLQSLVFAMASILVVIGLVFMSLKAGLLAMIPNIVPILALLGMMGWMGIEIDASNGFVALIALGIAVDDTLHFMARYNTELKATSNQRLALNNTIQHEMVPAFSTSFALMVGFLVYLFSEFNSNIEFGILTSMVLGVAFLSDMFITPLVLANSNLVTSLDLLSMRLSEAALKTSPIFKGMKLGELKRIALLGVLRDYTPGAPIVVTGEASREMYVILEGGAEVVVRNTKGEQIRSVSLKAGDVFGEMAFITGDARSADVNAVGATQVLAIDNDSMGRVQNRFPRVAAKFYSNVASVLSNRLQDSNRKSALPA